jgi:hypothetical protein
LSCTKNGVFFSAGSCKKNTIFGAAQKKLGPSYFVRALVHCPLIATKPLYKIS